MPANSDRLQLPYLDAGQAQKEISHNEALAILDFLLQGAIVDLDLNDPPVSPSAGQCWIVGGSPTGAWTDRAQAVACWTGGGWRFASARAGMSFWHEGEGYHIHYDGIEWVNGIIPAISLEIGGIQVVGPQSGVIHDPAGGTVIDIEGREAIDQILMSLRTHGLIAA